MAGIAMGLIKEGDDYIVLSDIACVEDHLGDMDFKMAGTADGNTAPARRVHSPMSALRGFRAAVAKLRA